MERLEAAFGASRSWWKQRDLSLFAKTVVILLAEVVLNALVWIITVIVFTRTSADEERILGLALVAWTTGLRHGLDADHISAIDNATRRIVSVPQLNYRGQPRLRRPVTVGLFFSLGHSTIVVVTIIAIAISAGVAKNLDSYGNVGSVIGASVSGSFLILIGCINTVILYRTWSRLRAATRTQESLQSNAVGEAGGGEKASLSSQPRFNGLITRLAMPLLRTVDRPWKLFPVGLLFGLGFDTASSIALLSVAVIAQQEGGGNSTNGNVVLLAFLFTAGMTLVDSIDSCLMIWAYAPDLARNGRKRMTLWEEGEAECMRRQGDDAAPEEAAVSPALSTTAEMQVEFRAAKDCKEEPNDLQDLRSDIVEPAEATPNERSSPDQVLASLDASASRFSLVLTLLSILIAFVIGTIVLLGLIGEQCARCSRAADLQEDSGQGGLEGRWWLAWRRANDSSGYVGATVVGLFALCLVCYFIIRWARQRRTAASL